MSPQPKDTEIQPFLSKYVDNPTENEPQLLHYYKQALSRRTRIISHIAVFLLTSSLWLTILALLSPKALNPLHKSSAPGDPGHNITTNAHLQTCGNTIEEARKAGCEYDILLNAFVPKPCYDDEFILEYTDDSSWGAYSDTNLSIPLSVSQMSESEYYYTSVRDHKNHCGILWKKQFFALFEEKRTIDTIVASAGHTDHCAQYLMDVEESKVDEATRVERGFAGCWVRD